MTASSALGLIGATLLLAWAATPLLRRLHPARHGRAMLLVAVMAAAWIPAGGMPLAGYVRGVIGDLSLTTLVLLAAALCAFLLERRFGSLRERAIGYGLVLIAALLLYPMALGLGGFDPYALGYHAAPGAAAFAAGLGALALAAWIARLPWIVCSLLAAVIAHLAGAMESANLWDALIDPLLAGYALLWILRAGRSGWRLRRGAA